jgi:hypothetical protein
MDFTLDILWYQKIFAFDFQITQLLIYQIFQGSLMSSTAIANSMLAAGVSESSLFPAAEDRYSNIGFT